ncbi:MAG TPA: 5-carboxymethyl-2-hydroxymuconate semialdehyde dehydrogenase [Solirubrobacterales bacterium]|nr:5-carboxymethyl-2-hydroxymuconate semialdehyde dehydrogenase [Solirubrobacterales bacterium]
MSATRITDAERSDATACRRRAVEAVGPQRHFIGGEFRESASGETFETHDPASGEALASAPAGGPAEVDAAVGAARQAFDAGDWPRMSAAERAEALRRVAALLRRDADDFIDLECLDIGMPIAQMRGLAARAAQNFEYFARVVEELGGRAHRVGADFLNYTIHKPVGVAALIMPWNAPLMLSTWRIAPCLAAGNTIILKPAEWSPLTATRLAALLDEAKLPTGAFNLVHGFGETAGAALTAHPGIDLLCFTGESATGRTIMASGAATLKRTSFELGGKSPVVVFADSDFDRAVDAVVAQIFTMNGQRCTAGSRLLVEREIYEPLVAAIAERARCIRLGDPFDPATELGPLIGTEHRERVGEYLRSANDEGARTLAGGATPDGLAPNYLEATVLADVGEEMRVFREEIFGPVLVATPFDDEAGAIRLANATRYGLAAYVWTNDLGRAHRVAQSIDAGLCWINSQNVRDLRTPFGGVKDSGIGREGGDYSFEFYCELETIHVALHEHSIPRLGLGAEGGGR